ncbi:MAG TPA: hypothetical protein VK163_06220 [Opitutaceae bacterium]|nr:hypothetical protein [Opitutaceae bacterium]
MFVALGWWCAVAGLLAEEFPKVAENGSLRLTVSSVRTAENYGGKSAPQGRQWFVVGCRWLNRIDARRAAEREAVTMVEIGDLAKHLYLVADGALGTLQRLGGERGRKSLGEIVLGKPGDSLIGDLVFEIPAGRGVGAELRFYDDIAGHFTMVLGEPPPAARPVGSLARNQVGEFGVFRVEDPAAAPEGVVVPHGRRLVAVDFRGRSLWKSTGDAPIYDFSKPTGAQVERVNLLDWPGTAQSCVLLADGEYVYLPIGGTLPDDARFLPEVFTGGTLLFAVPCEARSLELLGTLGHAGTEEGVLDLAPVRLRVSGGEARPAEWTLPLKLTDEMFRVAVAARRERSFAGENADEGREFLVLDVGVENTAGGGEYFYPAEQLQVVAGEADPIACDEATWRGTRAPARAVYVPAGERRRFELAFRVAVGASPKLVFRGGTFEEQYELPGATP